MLNRLLDGFEGKLTSSKWAKLEKCSQDTALRDISDLVERGIEADVTIGIGGPPGSRPIPGRDDVRVHLRSSAVSKILQGPLGRRHGVADARVALERHAQRPPKGLEYRLGNVVRVPPTQTIEMQGHQGVIGEALKKFMEQVDVEIADARARKLDVVLKPRAPG